MSNIVLPSDTIDVRLGEKPTKIMQMYQADFPIPPFITILGNKTGGIDITDALKREIERIGVPIILRSAHRLEGNGHSFSGMFTSLRNVVRLTDGPEDRKNYVEPMDRPKDFPEDTDLMGDVFSTWRNERTLSIQGAYREMIEEADLNGRFKSCNDIKKYIQRNNIQGYSHLDMNAVAMRQRDLDVFGMFLTSMQAAPHLIQIQYEDRRQKKGSWAIYNTTTFSFQEELPEGLERILQRFAQLAVRTQKLFGKMQQIEVGASDQGVEIFQARDIDIGNPASVPRFANYKTLSTELNADGYGYHRLPVFVMDSIDAVHSDYFETSQESMEKVILPYREAAKRFVAEHEKFALVIKDGEAFIPKYDEVGEKYLLQSRKESYALLNSIASKATVVFQGKNQNTIRHDAWQAVESGGIRVYLSEGEQMANLFIHNHIVGNAALFRASSYAADCGSRRSYIPRNVKKITALEPIQTGDVINVLSNTNGVFVWQDEQ